MNQRLLKISLLALVAAAVAVVTPSAFADDTNSAPAASDQAMKGKFNGTVSAVDTNAMTFTVDDQTYMVTDDTQLSRNGKTATLADVVVGDPVRGSYSKGADGKMTVAKVRFGKGGGKKKKNSDSGSSDSSAPAAPAAPPATQ
jgi:hypothetical protein